MKFVLIPDSFKGTMTSIEICQILEDSIHRRFSEAQVRSIPVADGGEGTVDAFLCALGGETIEAAVAGPYGEPMTAAYGLLDGGETAVIEMAACAGLPLVEGRRNPGLTTTYGVGELLLDAARRGVRRIIVGLGGSATNDGGCGAAAAAGIRFLDSSGEVFHPTGATLKDIARIDDSARSPELTGVEILTMCDIDNPMHGPQGAAYIFGPQKGADPAMVRDLDEGLIHLAEVIRRDLGRDLSELPGAGAAGAMGAGMAAFFGSLLRQGIQIVLDTVEFDRLISDCDYILTGEGRIDSQSLRGKVVMGVAGRAKAQNKPVLVIAGGADGDLEPAYAGGVTAIFTINRLPELLEVSRYKSRENLAATADNILRLIQAALPVH